MAPAGCAAPCEPGLTVEEVLSIITLLVPLSFVAYRRIFGTHACARPRAARQAGGAAAAAYDFSELMSKFRAADPDRRGLDVSNLEFIVDAESAAALRKQLAEEGRPAGRRISVAEFVPLA